MPFLNFTNIIFIFLHRYIDQGRNPQLYTKECLERALAKNEQVKGKIDTMTVRQHFHFTFTTELLKSRVRYNVHRWTTDVFDETVHRLSIDVIFKTECISLQKFKSLLIAELGKVFPEEMAKYKAIHGDDPPS